VLHHQIVPVAEILSVVSVPEYLATLERSNVLSASESKTTMDLLRTFTTSLDGGMSNMKIILMGCPGYGKGTQAKILAKKFDIEHLSPGEIFRSEMKKNSSLGQRVKEYMDAGDLVPTDVVVNLIVSRLLWPKPLKGFILDGFPRTEEQSQLFRERYVNNNIHCICFNVADVVAIERLKSRGREDDGEKIIAKRIKDYRDRELPLITHLTRTYPLGVLLCSADKPIEEVTEECLKRITTTSAV